MFQGWSTKVGQKVLRLIESIMSDICQVESSQAKSRLQLEVWKYLQPKIPKIPTLSTSQDTTSKEWENTSKPNCGQHCTCKADTSVHLYSGRHYCTTVLYCTVHVYSGRQIMAEHVFLCIAYSTAPSASRASCDVVHSSLFTILQYTTVQYALQYSTLQ